MVFLAGRKENGGNSRNESNDLVSYPNILESGF